MNQPVFDATAGKKACNVSVNRDLLEKVRAAGIGVSAVLERALEEELRKAAEETWKKNNQGAIRAYNRRIDEDGTFAEQEGLI